jgi:hypothetical protein
VKKLPDSEVTEDRLRKLQEHAAVLRELVEKASEQAEEAERAVEYLQKKLAAPNGRPDGAAGGTNGEE